MGNLLDALKTKAIFKELIFIIIMICEMPRYF